VTVSDRDRLHAVALARAWLAHDADAMRVLRGAVGAEVGGALLELVGVLAAAASGGRPDALLEQLAANIPPHEGEER